MTIAKFSYNEINNMSKVLSYMNRVCNNLISIYLRKLFVSWGHVLIDKKNEFNIVVCSENLNGKIHEISKSATSKFYYFSCEQKE